jgi:hypothetical protein
MGDQLLIREDIVRIYNMGLDAVVQLIVRWTPYSD